MFYQKRGISPLIATVLILGFTVALGVLIINFSTSFTRNIQEQTTESSNTQIICAQEVLFSISNACDAGNNIVRVTVKNDGSRDIDRFISRFYRSESDVAQETLTFINNGNGISSFNIESDEVTIPNGPVRQVELIPVVTISGKSVTCSTNVDSFGAVLGDGLLGC
ncbi:hypothetical protein J4430_02715 [Candidatus Woesearchaeota archaeon]|nr:hypothetical protein [Candidatus Woesearchaeota archaeon]